MPSMFGRFGPHSYDLAIQMWLRQRNLQSKAMAINLMCDHRVSVEREKSFDSLTNSPRTDPELRDAIIKYKELHIKTSRTPQFLDAAVNKNNIVSGSPGVEQVIHKDQQLVRVLDLNGLTPVFQWAKRQKVMTFASFPTRPLPRNVDTWLRRMIRQLQPEQFVRACLDAMNDYRRNVPFQPAWAAGWQKFQPYIRQGGDRWLEVMGMHREFGGRWLIMLRYTVGEAGTVARPTQLDVGWGPYHFPSPPHAYVRTGGHPMDLKIVPVHTELLSEFIHQQINHTVKHWTDAGGVIERTSGPTSGSLDLQRINHHRRLVFRYGHYIYYWMPKCI